MPATGLLLLLLALLLPSGLTAYPVFGTKRYGRSSGPVHNWPISSPVHVPSYYYQAFPRAHYPVSYYDAISPYAQDYAEDYYYPQEAVTYPVYYPPPARSLKFDIYQTAYPYYYDERHVPHPYNYYDSADPVDDLQEEMIHEEEREEREEALPIGQETWYETDGAQEPDESMDDVNAAFLQNLMMYNDAIASQKYEYAGQDYYGQGYKDRDYAEDWNLENLNKNYQEDEDVKELKMLVDKPKKQKNKKKQNKHNVAQERLEMFEGKAKGQKAKAIGEPNNSEAWINWSSKRVPHQISPMSALMHKKQAEQMKEQKKEQKKELKKELKKERAPASRPPTAATSTTTEEPARDARGGQKEVVLIRPATPVRRPFSEPVMELLAQQGGPERKRTPSVYDTIKHLLEMEKSLEEEYARDQPRPPMRKRFVSNEESLVDQLSGLKRTA